MKRVSPGTVESSQQKSFAATKKVICRLGFASLNVSDPAAASECGSHGMPVSSLPILISLKTLPYD